jgi:hypothetical protein
MELTRECIAEIYLTAKKTDRLTITLKTISGKAARSFDMILSYETFKVIGPGQERGTRPGVDNSL